MTRLLEYQVKDILESERIRVPRRRLCATPAEVVEAFRELGAPLYLKAQVPAGDRARHGGIARVEDAAAAHEAAVQMLGIAIQGIAVTSILAEEGVTGAWEGYAAVSVEEGPARRVLRFSREGGTGFDPSQAPLQLDLVDALVPHRLRSELMRIGTASAELVATAAFLQRLAFVAHRWAAYTLELNPVTLTADGVVALDAKADLDDYSKALIPDPSYLDEEDRDIRERTAREYQATDHRGSLRYVQLIPDTVTPEPTMVASHSVGGGESMVVLDALASAGLRPTNYCDTSGSPSAAKVSTAAQLVAGQPHAAGLLFSTCIANQPLSVTAEGLLDGWRKVGWAGPTVVRFAGNQAEQARQMVRDWAEETGSLVVVVGEETNEWEAAAHLARLLTEGTVTA